ncbi:Bug family tripartite tricarboxylate transporter substrate binding protein [Siccirubricoccus phaeus]|uniref:Bug family tripartite tricarboxylate transporter substrate binding protein n=1 Tax=Siccirubricoccus phaeus TaxID=2595053 RepID=UPI0011F196C2|nr:tripartite tricarboxylate transporter substrate binding protein [Siccirubricoccus phaeus]
MPRLARRPALAAALALLARGGPALAQAPSQAPSGRPVTLVVPNPPGGGTDFAARLFQDRLGALLGQPVVIENKPGANGNIAIQAVVRAAPDGLTLLMQYSGYHAGNPAMIPNLPWDPVRDLAPVGMATVAPHAILVPASLPVQTLQELIAYAKARPGQLNFASSGNGSIQHIGGVLFARAIGVPMVHVPYRGAAPALQDVAGGRIELFVTTPSSAIGLIQGGQVRALAIASDARIPALPGVPTTAEAGLPGFTVDAWFAVFAPAATPRPVLERLNAAMREATRDPDLQRRAQEGGVVLRALTLAEMDAVARKEIEELGRTIRTAEIRLE